MYRISVANKTNTWLSYLPRPVFVLSVSYNVLSPLRLIPVSDFLRTEFRLELSQLIFKNKEAKWVASLHDNSTGRYGETTLLPPLEESDMLPLEIQGSGSAVKTVHFSVSSKTTNVESSKKIGMCIKEASYSYEQVALYYWSIVHITGKSVILVLITHNSAVIRDSLVYYVQHTFQVLW